MILLTQQAIDAIFEAATTQEDYIIGLHRTIFPDWAQIEQVGHPIVSQRTWEYIARKAIEFDQVHHPDVFAGGAWLNWGFSTGKVRDGSVSLKGVIVRRKVAV